MEVDRALLMELMGLLGRVKFCLEQKEVDEAKKAADECFNKVRAILIGPERKEAITRNGEAN